jgi:hypothetical protein
MTRAIIAPSVHPVSRNLAAPARPAGKKPAHQNPRSQGIPPMPAWYAVWAVAIKGRRRLLESWVRRDKAREIADSFNACCPSGTVHAVVERCG